MKPAVFLPVIVLCLVTALPAHAQTLTVIHAFTGGSDGAFPDSGLTTDAHGNLYGTTSFGGKKGCTSDQGCGTVFKLFRSGTSWVLKTIYQFQGNSDGWEPFARVVFGRDGNLYGTTQYGGIQPPKTLGYGTVFKLTPPTSDCQAPCWWTHTVLYRFTGGSDGASPGTGDLIFDGDGNIYGTAEAGGLIKNSCVPIAGPGCGVVFELNPSNNGWTEQVVYSFTGDLQGSLPIGGVVFDPKGSLLGTASEGGASSYGTVFQLIPSGSAWQEKTLHSFSGYADGGYPAASLLADRDDQLFFGTTSSSLSGNGGGTVFQVSPSAQGYTFQTTYLLPGTDDPLASVSEHNDDLYGTTPDGGAGFGDVFELVQNSGEWTFTTLHNFTAGHDGWSPNGNVLVDSNGNVYGTTFLGGQYSDGVIFEITP